MRIANIRSDGDDALADVTFQRVLFRLLSLKFFNLMDVTIPVCWYLYK